MGVHGLTTFISHYRDQYKEKLYIRNMPVVIDGCNLMYFLYFEGQNSVVNRGQQGRKSGSSSPAKTPKKKLPHAYLFGGDWEHYAQNIRHFFQQIKQCNIIPIVLMDGAYDASKLEVAKNRFAKTVMDNVRKSDGVGSDGFPGKTYTPVFLKTVFLEVLSEQKILHYQTVGEADSTIAFIAQLLKNCPVLSCDSDFYIYGNTKMIQLPSLKYSKVKLDKKSKTKEDAAAETELSEKVWTLQGEFIPLPKLCKQLFNLNNHQSLGLAAVILGNDILQHGVFRNFQSSQIGDNNNLKIRTANVMKWLAKQKSVEDAIQTLLRYIPEHKKVETENGIKRSLAMYDGEDGEKNIWHLLIKDSESLLEEFIEKDAVERVFSIENNMQMLSLGENNETDALSISRLPEAYVNKHISCQYQSYLLNIFKNHVVFLPPQIEIYDAAGSHEFSIPIIQVIAGILIGNTTSEVDLVTHQKGKMFKKTIYPVMELQQFGPLPTLVPDLEGKQTEDLNKLSREEKADLVVAALGINDNESNPDDVFFKQWPSSYRIWIATLLYYSKNLFNSSRLEKYESLAVVTSLYLCVIRNLIVNPGNSGRASGNFSAITFLHGVTGRDPIELQKIRKFYQKFEDYSEVTSKKFMRTYDIRLSNCLSEYLCILFHTEMLNNLLDNPFKSPKVRYNMNNFFVYNFAHYAADFVTSHRGDEDDASFKDLIVDATGIDILKQVLAEFVEVVYS